MTLSEREYECAMLCAQALSNAEIAERLGTHEGTVKQYMQRALLKTGARNRTELALMFVRGQLPKVASERVA